MTEQLLPENVTVSVSIPSCEKYTPPEMLTEAIESAESPVGVDIECIVVEDEYKRGPAWARNVGLDRAEARYVVFLAPDDIWKETKPAEQLRKMDATGAGMCVDSEVEYGPNEFAEALLTGETFGLPSSILGDTDRTETRFDETLEHREDLVYMIEMAIDVSVCVCPGTFEAQKYEDGLSEHVDMSLEQIERFFHELVERVPAVEQFEAAYYQNSYVYLGRSRHEDSDYWTAVRYYAQSMKYGLTLLSFGALGLTVAWDAYDHLTRPACRFLEGRLMTKSDEEYDYRVVESDRIETTLHRNSFGDQR